MLLELMSNGSLAELPPGSIPDNILPALPDETSVMLLLPHNKYLLGTGSDNWLYGQPGTAPQSVYLYDNESISLLNDGDRPTVLPPRTVNALRRKLSMNTDPPGRHSAAILMLRTIMRDNPVFSMTSAEFLDEKIFAGYMEEDEVLRRTYWTLRFALARGEMETVRRLKAWLKVGPDVFAQPSHTVKMWFSIQNLPDPDAVKELEELSFAVPELQRMSAQMISPLVLYNPLSGWLVLGRFGRGRDIMFSCWIYANHEIWHEMREVRKMTVQDIINAVWGELETIQALDERAKYR